MSIFGILGLIHPSLRAEAPSVSAIDALRKSIEVKNEEIKKLEKEARRYTEARNATQKKQKTLANELASLNEDITELNFTIIITEKKVVQTEELLSEIALEIKNLEGFIDENKQAMASVLKALYADENSNTLFFALSQETFSRAFAEIQHSESLNASLYVRLKSTKSLRSHVTAKQGETETQKQKLEQLATKLENEKALTQNIKKEKDTLLKKTKNQETTYKKLISEAEKRKEEVQKDIEDLEEVLRRTIDPSSLPPPRKDYFAHPVEGRFSSDYGERVHPLGLGLKFHNGIDIGAKVGTPIYAPYGGTITALGDSDTHCYRGAYGKWLLIDHGNNLVTMYAHLSVHRVNVGQSVEKGQLVGLVGNTGSSTGPHLHFTVYDARTVSVRPSRVCGLLPYGGSIDPLDYLSYN